MAKHSGIQRRNRFQASLLANEAGYRALQSTLSTSKKIAGVTAAGLQGPGVQSLAKVAGALNAIGFAAQ
jgi:hypothetical protein